ncbi:MFS transporter [Sphingomonas abietis]|uniref:MFS transporter n=1 Tax=Sphingomonas abietis TaxID=3012344 RepID=UPI002DD6A05E|nr:MFS transporter [Sphingomonas abietis]
MMVPLALVLFGFGMTVGSYVIPHLAEGRIMLAIGALLTFVAVSLMLFALFCGSTGGVLITAFLIGCGGALATVLQTRLMEVAGEAQALASALNQSAFNLANALGPFLAGLAIDAGYGWKGAGWTGALLSLLGIAIWGIAAAVPSKSQVQAT